MALFKLGAVTVTPAARAALDTAGADLAAFLARHQAGDWGEVDERDRAESEFALASERAIYAPSSVYRLPGGTEVLIMTAADRACVNTMRQALDLCDRIDPARGGMLGVALDVYHVWWDFELMAQIERAGPSRLLAFHVCDWLVPTADTVNDRGMPGDGIIDIPRIRAAVEAQGFNGYVEVEIFSNRWWSAPMDEVMATAIARMKTAV